MILLWLGYLLIAAWVFWLEVVSDIEPPANDYYPTLSSELS